MTTIDNMTVTLGFEADEAIESLTQAATALAEVSAPAIRLECLNHARAMLGHQDPWSLGPEVQEAWVNCTIALADRLAAFVLHGTVPTKN